MNADVGKAVRMGAHIVEREPDSLAFQLAGKPPPLPPLAFVARAG